MFIDKAIIHIRAGNGGNGAVAFHREKYVASGGPDGGDGGRGGNVVFIADDGANTLSDFRYKRKYAAENGAPGASRRCFGKNGADCVIPVPRGTLIYDNATGRLMADMSGDEPFVAAKGGRGGWGNSHFATPTRQTPRFAKPGVPGEAYELRLELKLLADVGLVGFPNVGKSTLISVVSEAKPEIANYHFTTLTPVLGVVRVGEGSSFVMADIPGIIEGASDGVGLGHDFLRHIERCRLLIHVVDVAGSEGRDPYEDFAVINRELKSFSPDLAARPMIVAGNKCDLVSDEEVARFAAFIEEQGYEFYPMMAAIAHGTEELTNACARALLDAGADAVQMQGEQTAGEGNVRILRTEQSCRHQQGCARVEAHIPRGMLTVKPAAQGGFQLGTALRRVRRVGADAPRILRVDVIAALVFACQCVDFAVCKHCNLLSESLYQCPPPEPP